MLPRGNLTPGSASDINPMSRENLEFLKKSQQGKHYRERQQMWSSGTIS